MAACELVVETDGVTETGAVKGREKDVTHAHHVEVKITISVLRQYIISRS